VKEKKGGGIKGSSKVQDDTTEEVKVISRNLKKAQDVLVKLK
jgi:hypothetical protein